MRSILYFSGSLKRRMWAIAIIQHTREGAAAFLAFIQRAFLEEPGLFLLFGGLSLFLFFATLLAIPLFIAAIPRDYFTRKHRPLGSRYAESRHPLLLLLLKLLKNVLGALFCLMGLIMLFTPGQGLLTLFAGLLLLDFPGKRKLEIRLLRKRAVLGAVIWIRKKAKVEPLEWPGEEQWGLQGKGSLFCRTLTALWRRNYSFLHQKERSRPCP
jgi:hypothetical protein